LQLRTIWKRLWRAIQNHKERQLCRASPVSSGRGTTTGINPTPAYEWKGLRPTQWTKLFRWGRRIQLGSWVTALHKVTYKIRHGRSGSRDTWPRIRRDDPGKRPLRY